MAGAHTARDASGPGRQSGQQAPGASPARGERRRRAVHSAVAFAFLAGVTAYARNGRLWPLDQTAIRVLQARRRPAAVSAARAVSALAEPAFVAPLLAVFTATTARRAGWRAACMPCVVVAGGAVARRGLARAIARPRPPATAWLAEPEGFSLPSKHTTLAALTAGACAAGAGGRGTSRHVVPLLAAAAVGASRVYLGVHWPSDVLAAWLFAEGWLCLAESVEPAPARCGGRPADGSRESATR